MWALFALGSSLAFCFVSVCDKRLLSFHLGGGRGAVVPVVRRLRSAVRHRGYPGAGVCRPACRGRWRRRRWWAGLLMARLGGAAVSRAAADGSLPRRGHLRRPTPSTWRYWRCCSWASASRIGQWGGIRTGGRRRGADFGAAVPGTTLRTHRLRYGSQRAQRGGTDPGRPLGHLLGRRYCC